MIMQQQMFVTVIVETTTKYNTVTSIIERKKTLIGGCPKATKLTVLGS